MKTILANILIGFLTLVSSCIGSSIVTQKLLNSYENQSRIKNVQITKQRVREISDSITLARITHIDSRDTILYIACSNGIHQKFTYNLPIEWERDVAPDRVAISAKKGDKDFYIASILGRNCSISRTPLN